MSSIILFCVLLNYLIFIVPSYGEFPNHDQNEDKMVNITLDALDDPACGLFRAPPPNWSARVFKGKTPYSGQFPWTVCLIEGIGIWRKTDSDDHSNDADVTDIEDFIFTAGYPNAYFPHISYELTVLESWSQFCTGSIIAENWILTAAHCFTQMWEGFVLIINSGSLNCKIHSHATYTREIVISRIDNEINSNIRSHRTLFEHPKWMASEGDIHSPGNKGIAYDIALIRLDNPYILPTGVYGNQLINRICIYSTSDLPKRGCLKNVYFSGYGWKRDPEKFSPNAIDRFSALTYMQAFRTAPEYCITASGRPETKGKYCFSSVLRHAYIREKILGPSRKDIDMKNRTELEDTPNPCAGDSGGPYAYYMKTDNTYRALQLSVLSGVYRDMSVDKESECDYEYRLAPPINWWQKWRYPYEATFKSVDVGPKLHNIVHSDWWRETMATKETGYLAKTGAHAYYSYPDTA